jgi:hypothetical protein
MQWSTIRNSTSLLHGVQGVPHRGVVHPGEDGAQALDRRSGELARDVMGAVGQQDGRGPIGQPEHPHRTARAGTDDAVRRGEGRHLLLELERADHRVPRRHVVLVRTEGHPAHGRPQPVRADHQVEALAVLRAGAGILEQHLHVLAGVVDLDGRGREPHVDPPTTRSVPGDALPERGFDVTAEHCSGIARLVQESHARLMGPPTGQRPRLPAVGRVAGVQVAVDAQIDRRLPTFRHQTDEVATPPTPGAPLDDHRRPSGPMQPDRRGHAGDRQPDDQCSLLHDAHNL